MSNERYHVVYTEITQHEFNQYLDFCIETNKTLRYGKYQEFITDIVGAEYIKVGNTKLYLTFKKGGNWFSYMTDLTKEYEEDFEDKVVDPSRAYALFKRFVKFEDAKDPVNIVPPYSNKNEKYINNRYYNCIGYDMNNARVNSCNNLLVPIKRINEYRAPRENEVGFLFSGQPIYGPSNVKCSYLFTCGINEGLQKWVEYLKVKLKENKPYWKKMHNYSIGMLRRHNIFMYNCIMYKENQIMKSLWDDETSLWSTTDSIVSLVERPDLTISNEVGDFKIEHKGDFAYISSGYQWNKDVPKIKGFSPGKVELYNETHEDKFDILKKEYTFIDKTRYKVKDGYIINEKGEKV